MQRIFAWMFATIVAVSLFAPQFTYAAGAKKYQVTGTIIEMTEEMVVVQRSDGEKWELNRDPKMVVKGELKVGEKVTIQYTMTATNAEVKPTK